MRGSSQFVSGLAFGECMQVSDEQDTLGDARVRLEGDEWLDHSQIIAQMGHARRLDARQYQVTDVIDCG